MFGIPNVALVGGIGVVASLVFLGVGYFYGARSAANVNFEALEDIEGAEGFEIYSTGDKGVIGSWMQDREKNKALQKGLVRWHLVGSSFEKPKYIKPEREPGGSVPEVEHEGETYLFPPEAAKPSQEEGVPVFVHRKGESDPLELADNWELSLDAKQLKDYLESRVTSDSPSGLGLGIGNLDTMDILKYGTLAIVAFFVVLQIMNGGIA